MERQNNFNNNKDEIKGEIIQYQYFNINKIINNADISDSNLSKGKKLFEGGKVEINEISSGYIEQKEELIVIVKGIVTNKFNNIEVEIYVSQSKIEYSYCGCNKCRNQYYYYSEFKEGTRNCECVAALIYKFQEYIKNNKIGDATDYSGACFINNFKNIREKKILVDAAGVDDILTIEPRIVNKDNELNLSFRIGNTKKYIIKDLMEFSRQIKNGAIVEYGSNAKFTLKMENFTETSKKYIKLIKQVVTEEEALFYRVESMRGYNNKNIKLVTQNIHLTGWKLDEMFSMMENSGVDYEEIKNKAKIKGVLTASNENPNTTLKVSKTGYEDEKAFHGISIEGQLPHIFYGASNYYFIKDLRLCRINEDYINHTEFLFEQAENDKISMHLGRKNLSEWFYVVKPYIEDYINIVNEDMDVIEKYIKPEAIFKFYLDIEDDSLLCNAKACYGDKEYPLLDNYRNTNWSDVNDNENRLESKEHEALIVAREFFPMINETKDCLMTENTNDNLYKIISVGINELIGLGEVHSTDKFKKINIAKKPKISIGVSLSNGLLNLEVSTDNISREDLADVLKSYQVKKKYHRLKNGDFVNLEDDNIEALKELMESMHISLKDFVKGKMKIPAYRAIYLDKMLEEHENIYAERDTHFRNLIKDFKTVSEADFIEPKSLKNVLRNYQRTGYRWLRTLESNKLGGILADDMGLGKTLQVISVLLAAKNENPKKKMVSLIVCPASLVFNWGEEINKFAPTLNYGLVTGTLKERKELLQNIDNYDVLVTSYDLLKRDITKYEDTTFEYQIIDEAQYIKNHTTEASKSVKIIKANVRFALTGTPIENKLSELWSIFDYLMPGFLYGYDVFKKVFETAIVKYNDEDATKRLQKMVSPFILRRLKKDVLKDLPDKLEEVQYAKFDDEQRKLYDAQVVHMQNLINSQADSDFSKNKLLVLAEITKLRQICCDPGLCFENYNGDSAKRQACIDLVESAIDGKHKILLFSQFTSMLAKIEEDLKAKKISYYIITGSTPKEKRLEMVKKFNNDNTSVFLISLKAGGTGLNLTGADVVIHYDPWWNLAVQNQATDRAHRIGQTKNVTVYKLITKDTIEEKIQKIQDSKKDLAEQILNTDTGNIGALSKEDLLSLLG